ncbi:MAG: YCF48-related protein, partial [Calditrichota bacterium]
FKDAQTGIVTADFGNILRTTDGGNTWDIISTTGSTINAYYKSVVHTSGNTWFISGSFGMILKSTDDGLTWSLFEHPTTSYFQDIYFIDDFVGWAAGTAGLFAKTTDGGISWNVQIHSQGFNFYDIHFKDPLNGWATTFPNGLYTTNDGGVTWSRAIVNTNDNSLGQFVRFTIADNQTFYVVGDDAIYKSADSGATWQRVDKSLPFDMYKSIFFNSPDNGWITGNAKNPGEILSTENGGNDWDVVQIPTSETSTSGVYFLNSNQGWIGVWGAVLNTQDGGNTWNQTIVPNATLVSGIVNPDPFNSWVKASAKVYYSDGSGYTLQDPGYINISGIEFTDSQNGWAITRIGRIFHTNDGGQNWVEQSSPVSSILRDIEFINSQVGWCVGNQGTILKTVDGGANWENLGSSTQQYFVRLQAIDENKVWMWERGGYTIHVTQNGGINWQTIMVPKSLRGFTYFFVDDNTVFGTGGLTTKATIVKGTIDLPTSIEDPNQARNDVPQSIQLNTNYPNPFNPSTTITYSLDKSSRVELAIFTPLGQHLETLVNEWQAAGAYQKVFHAKNYPSGTYYYRLTVDGEQQTKGMLLVK